MLRAGQIRTAKRPGRPAFEFRLLSLLDSLEEDGEDAGVEQAQVTELIRRMQALHAGQVKLIDDAEARARVMARLRSVRGQ